MNPAPDETALLALDESIDALASSGEFDTLASLLADGFHYMHSTGAIQSKSEWIEGLRKLVGQRQRLVSNLLVDQHDDLAVVTGDLDVVWNDGRHAFDRYIRVYKLVEGTWLVLYQRTFPALDRAPG